MRARSGFGLLELLIVIAILALIMTGGFYIKNLQGQRSTLEIGTNALQQAEQLKQKLNQQAHEQETQNKTIR